jgi:hypothetical protein
MSKYDFTADGVKFAPERRVDCSTSKCDAYGATKKGRDIVPALQCGDYRLRTLSAISCAGFAPFLNSKPRKDTTF